jgi:AhpD family alkylhydroperoxidase
MSGRPLARHPSVMERFAAEMKAVFAPDKLAPSGASRHLPHEVGEAGRGNLAVSIANQCDYCTASHGAMARRKGMTEEMYEEFMAVVLAAQKGNKITTGYRLPGDAAFEEK